MKIICIGRNYAEHAKEMRSEQPSEPVFFMKPETALLKDPKEFYYPGFTKDLHHEVEIVLKISKNGRHIAEEFAHTYYNEIGIGIDFTARDIQVKCKEKGLPWEKAKAFDNSAPVSDFVPKEKFASVQDISFSLNINGTMRQQGNTRDLIFSNEKVIAYVSQFITLKTGDLVFTGTPAGVSAVHIGDVMEAYIGDKKLLHLEIK
ncbi:MAG TPA: fumarylacetoacetate hydrolase family protein [Bacteroidia bacterium]|jgi:acylpyruvate hydrolase|nr:fumarylacetoacetate hydrolase family protein [Bacteroidia bacterium]